MLVVGARIATACLMIAKTRGVVDINHQRNLIAVVGAIINIAAIVKHTACSASTGIEIVDMRASLAYC